MGMRNGEMGLKPMIGGEFLIQKGKGYLRYLWGVGGWEERIGIRIGVGIPFLMIVHVYYLDTAIFHPSCLFVWLSIYFLGHSPSKGLRKIFTS